MKKLSIEDMKNIYKCMSYKFFLEYYKLDNNSLTKIVWILFCSVNDLHIVVTVPNNRVKNIIQKEIKIIMNNTHFFAIKHVTYENDVKFEDSYGNIIYYLVKDVSKLYNLKGAHINGYVNVISLSDSHRGIKIDKFDEEFLRRYKPVMIANKMIIDEEYRL